MRIQRHVGKILLAALTGMGPVEVERQGVEELQLLVVLEEVLLLEPCRRLRIPRDLVLQSFLPIQFARYVGSVLQGDLGVSVSTSRPVAEDLVRVFPATLEMATLGILIGVLLGVPMGVWAAARQGSWVDQVIRVLGIAGLTIPVFWLAIMMSRFFGVGLGYGSPTYIPEVQTDYIFSAIGEELGLLGALAVICLYLIFVVRGFTIALRARDGYIQLFAAGLSSIQSTTM